MFKPKELTKPQKYSINVYKGRSIIVDLPLSSDNIVYKPISGISKSAPLRLSTPNHQLPNNWLVSVSDVRGMKEANLLDLVQVKILSKDVLEIPEVNSTGFSEYLGGGNLKFYQPLNLTGYTPKFTLVKNRKEIVPLDSLFCNIDATTNSINLNISADSTTKLTQSHYTYMIDLVAENVILPVVIGSVTIMKD